MKVIKIADCMNCPYFVRTGSEDPDKTGWCKLDRCYFAFHRHRDLYGAYMIPDWCLLEDMPEVE